METTENEIAIEETKNEKRNIIGSLAIMFAFLVPLAGLVLGILSVVFGVKKEDKDLLKDGIFAISASVVVSIVWILFVYVLMMIGVAVPFIVMS